MKSIRMISRLTTKRLEKGRKVKRSHWLADVINSNQYTVGAEVGAATGITTEFLLRHCQMMRRLFIADDWRPVGTPGHPWAMNNMEKVFKTKFQGDKRLTILKGLSWEMASQVEDKFLDFAFIDASHDYESVKKDLDAWTPKVRVGGMMCGHDINIVDGVKKAVEEKFGKYEDVGIDHVWSVKIL